eukprot:15091108-Alexandrium_andersonii.AAC.1
MMRQTDVPGIHADVTIGNFATGSSGHNLYLPAHPNLTAEPGFGVSTASNGDEVLHDPPRRLSLIHI